MSPTPPTLLSATEKLGLATAQTVDLITETALGKAGSGA